MNQRVPSQKNTSTLYFSSTQIQANYEDREQTDASVSRLGPFKNASVSPKFIKPQQAKVSKPKRKVTKKATRQINSISAFVKETLGGKKHVDPQKLLDQFLGDQKKLDRFLNEVDVATSTPHLLSKNRHDRGTGLFSGSEWKRFSESLRLKFPNLSKSNKKTLKVISKRLEDLRTKEAETASTQDSNLVWSQASRQPSEELSKEDLIWLYDLDEESRLSESSILHREESEPFKLGKSPKPKSPKSPVFLTLSQALEDRNQPVEPDSTTILDIEESSGDEMVRISSDYRDIYSPIKKTGNPFLDSQRLEDKNYFVVDSEPEIEPLSPAEFSTLLFATASKVESLRSQDTFAQKSNPGPPWNQGSVSATTSLVFGSTSNPDAGLGTSRKDEFSSSERPTTTVSKYPILEEANTELEGPVTPKKFKQTSAFNTPSCLRVDSSPLIKNQFIDSSPVSEHLTYSKWRTPTQESAGASEDVFLSANASFPKDTMGHFLAQSDTESVQISPLKKHQRNASPEILEVLGKVELDPSRSRRVQLKVLVSDRGLSDDVIPDSEEDQEAELSLVEISKSTMGSENVQNVLDARNTSVLQVPSSPENDRVQPTWEFHV